MHKMFWLCCALVLCTTCASAQTSPPLTWEQLRERFEQHNPALLADRLSIDESKAQEITANLRPNPNFTLLTDPPRQRLSSNALVATGAASHSLA